MNNNRNQRFKIISAAADKVVEETGVSPSEVSGYAICMTVFGKKPNGDFYVLFEEWLKERQAVPGAPPVNMPAEAAAQLEEWAEHLKVQLVQRVTGIVRGVAGTFEQTTSLRVTALEGLCADQSRRNKAVIETLVETDEDLAEARSRIAALDVELQQERDHVQRLLGAQDERNALLKALMPAQLDDGEMLVTPCDSGVRQSRAVDVANVDRQLGEDTTATGPIAPGDEQPIIVDDHESDQPSAIRDDHPAVGQAQLRLASSDVAGKADTAGDDDG